MNKAQALQTTAGSQGARATFAVAQPLAPEGLDVAASMVALRHLHFYRDLLRLGFEGTIWPDRASRTLRSERVALGIDLPELDLVAVWATRCGDGRVSIPFIEYLLARVRETAARFLVVDDRSIALRLGRLDEAIAAVAPGDAGPSEGARTQAQARSHANELPRLDEVFLDETDAVRLCGSGGIVDLLLQACEERCLAATSFS
ncbi:MAG TPA: hypothetical protein VGS03_07565 [Candidatus Polarisedimenticolia bacterium]|jgi:hypothetical protein|nr:hypothetical protein [Candidatus Polarisedimenticolia bacterium]